MTCADILRTLTSVNRSFCGAMTTSPSLNERLRVLKEAFYGAGTQLAHVVGARY